MTTQQPQQPVQPEPTTPQPGHPEFWNHIKNKINEQGTQS